jgi:hypothetical protein
VIVGFGLKGDGGEGDGARAVLMTDSSFQLEFWVEISPSRVTLPISGV